MITKPPYFELVKQFYNSHPHEDGWTILVQLNSTNVSLIAPNAKSIPLVSLTAMIKHDGKIIEYADSTDYQTVAAAEYEAITKLLTGRGVKVS